MMYTSLIERYNDAITSLNHQSMEWIRSEIEWDHDSQAFCNATTLDSNLDRLFTESIVLRQTLTRPSIIDWWLKRILYKMDAYHVFNHVEYM